MTRVSRANCPAALSAAVPSPTAARPRARPAQPPIDCRIRPPISIAALGATAVTTLAAVNGDNPRGSWSSAEAVRYRSIQQLTGREPDQIQRDGELRCTGRDAKGSRGGGKRRNDNVHTKGSARRHRNEQEKRCPHAPVQKRGGQYSHCRFRGPRLQRPRLRCIATMLGSATVRGRDQVPGRSGLQERGRKNSDQPIEGIVLRSKVGRSVFYKHRKASVTEPSTVMTLSITTGISAGRKTPDCRGLGQTSADLERQRSRRRARDRSQPRASGPSGVGQAGNQRIRDL